MDSVALLSLNEKKTFDEEEGMAVRESGSGVFDKLLDRRSWKCTLDMFIFVMKLFFLTSENDLHLMMELFDCPSIFCNLALS